jgi:prepilin-type N-terminal cleavage/methylation domain-containing protein
VIRTRPNRRGLTLIELMIGLAIAAMVAAISVGAVNSITDANLRSAAVELTGAVKYSYDRAIMQNRIQRLAMDIDSGTWWLEYTEDVFRLTEERTEGSSGVQRDDDGNLDLQERREELWRDLNIDERTDREVRKALEGGLASNFQLDDGEARRELPGGVRFSRVWTGHQEEPFEEGVAFLHFFKGGWTEPARIELEDEDGDVITLKVAPLTGRIRTYHRKMEAPEVEEWDGFEDGDET